MSHPQQAPGALRQLILQDTIHHDTHHHSPFHLQGEHISHRHRLAPGSRIGCVAPGRTRFPFKADSKSSNILIISTFASGRLHLSVLITLGLPHLQAFNLLSALHDGLGPDNLLHRFSREDKRIARQDMDAHIKIERVG